MAPVGKRPARAPWSSLAGQRLRLAIAAAGFAQSELRDENGDLIKRATLSGWLSGAQSPPLVRIEAVCRQLQVSLSSIVGDPDELDSVKGRVRGWGERMLDRVLLAEEQRPVINVPMYEIEVAAGHGRSPLQADPLGYWPLPPSWVAEHVGANPNLMIVRVVGDSQEPELHDGDSLIVDRDQIKLRPGLHVVELDEYLMVKRLQIVGKTVRLTSANKLYSDVVVEIPKDLSRFSIKGRVVAAIKVL